MAPPRIGPHSDSATLPPWWVDKRTGLVDPIGEDRIGFKNRELLRLPNSLTDMQGHNVWLYLRF